MLLNTTKFVLVFVLAVFASLTAGCSPQAYEQAGASYENGTYRGVFIDRDSIQVNVQFTLSDNVVTSASFRHLRRDQNYNLQTQRDPYKSVINQYREALEHLEDRNINNHLADLYHPEDIVSTEVDGYSAATIRSSKIISAIRDGLNRGVYSY